MHNDKMVVLDQTGAWMDPNHCFSFSLILMYVQWTKTNLNMKILLPDQCNCILDKMVIVGQDGAKGQNGSS